MPDNAPMRDAVLAMKKNGGKARMEQRPGMEVAEWFAGDVYICAKVMRRLVAHSFAALE